MLIVQANNEKPIFPTTQPRTGDLVFYPYIGRTEDERVLGNRRPAGKCLTSSVVDPTPSAFILIYKDVQQMTSAGKSF
jgi:hypothetical protein